MTRIIQISDTHVVAPPALVAGRVDTRACLAACVARIMTMQAEIGPIDLVLATGDLTDHGWAPEYRAFNEIMAPMTLPFAAIPGNHDRRAPFRAAFAGAPFIPAEGPLDWVRDFDDFRLIGLDTLVEGDDGGRLAAASLDFLRDALAAAADRPALIALHHPPFATGVKFMDEIGFADPGALAALIGGRRAETRVIAGHVHRHITGGIGGWPAITAPSTAHAIPVDFRPEAPVAFDMEPGGFLIHDWSRGFRSTHVAIARAAGPFPF